ncbi:protein Red [Phlebotomus argentipes]|uniref:protein Red n=1 Tax=Phlebotomus argentipes TaxID=94469 RepID=UPI0028931E35|nr:protein Red [Phlebotomus argentipes]XP_059609024.1 protein Red [Phlebotomus argentipes]
MPLEDAHDDLGSASQRLTNDDFRKLLMTPRTAPAYVSASSRGETQTKASATAKVSNSERYEARRKKKNFYAALKKQEDHKMSELAERYRDRARERRDGVNPDYQNTDQTGSSSSAYRTVAPDVKSGIDAAERRRQMIQESKFLGGDMEHTHLVKGLDYALLQKVRSEIVAKEQEQEEEMEKIVDEQEPPKAPEPERPKREEECKTVMGLNIKSLLAAQKSKVVERNELFLPGRMAYVIELEDENAENDIPTILIRSKADVPVSSVELQTLTTNDIVINKLSQILGYLRQGGKNKKNKKRDKDRPLFKETDKKADVDAIYTRDEVHEAAKHGESSTAGKAAIFGHPEAGYFDKSSKEMTKGSKSGGSFPKPPVKLPSGLISRLTAEPEGYAECYPGLQEMNDAIDDSDEEVDYTKMDLGNKKGPIGRWDFDTQEEYSDYMSTKEAMPKAAFQYGVKMQDGRKTRKHKTDKSEKAQLDREWQQIQNIIEKRKAKPSGEAPKAKASKY